MTYREVFELAKQNNFKGWDSLTDRELSDDGKYLELCFIHAELIKKHQIDCTPVYQFDSGEYRGKCGGKNIYFSITDKTYKSYAQALIEGVGKGLMMLLELSKQKGEVGNG